MISCWISKFKDYDLSEVFLWAWSFVYKFFYTVLKDSDIE